MIFWTLLASKCVTNQEKQNKDKSEKSNFYLIIYNIDNFRLNVLEYITKEKIILNYWDNFENYHVKY